jgi:hypothetical protein
MVGQFKRIWRWQEGTMPYINEEGPHFSTVNLTTSRSAKSEGTWRTLDTGNGYHLNKNYKILRGINICSGRVQTNTASVDSLNLAKVLLRWCTS